MNKFKAAHIDTLVRTLFTLDYLMIDDEHVAIVKHAYKVEIPSKFLDKSIIDGLFPVETYPQENCHRFEHEIGAINNLRIVIDESLDNKMIIRGPYDRILMELYFEGE